MDLKIFEYCFQYDDGKTMEGLESADVIILGPSRVGKTPLCFYLSYMGIKAMNIPLFPELNFDCSILSDYRKKTFGLTRTVDSLRDRRITREKSLGMNTNYSDTMRIIDELDYAENIYKKLGIPTIDLDKTAIEEASDFISDRIGK